MSAGRRIQLAHPTRCRPTDLLEAAVQSAAESSATGPWGFNLTLVVCNFYAPASTCLDVVDVEVTHRSAI
jgi:hypothetical protein